MQNTPSTPAETIGSYGDYSYPDYPDMKPDFTIDQRFNRYTAEDHAIWHELFARQTKLLPGRACEEYFAAFKKLAFLEEGIPRFEKLTEVTYRETGWEIVAVPGLIPADAFFTLLAQRRFPVTHWIRPREKMDYLIEPDIFHDLFGHVPLLIHPVFADYMQEYGQGALRAMQLGGDDYLKMITTLYWFTVEFGLIKNKDGIRIYGAGIVSSKGESIYSLESPAPNRLGFDLKRIMKTEYLIDDYQKTYWVIDSFEQLFEETHKDFKPFYEELAGKPTFAPEQVLPGDKVFQRGTVAG